MQNIACESLQVPYDGLTYNFGLTYDGGITYEIIYNIYIVLKVDSFMSVVMNEVMYPLLWCSLSISLSLSLSLSLCWFPLRRHMAAGIGTNMFIAGSYTHTHLLDLMIFLIPYIYLHRFTYLSIHLSTHPPMYLATYPSTYLISS